MTGIEFFIPGLPRGKGRPRFGGGRVYTPKRTRDYEMAIVDCATKYTATKLDGPLHLDLLITFPIPTSWPAEKKRLAMQGCLWHQSRPDLDNIIKIVGDALNGVLYDDDAQIVSVSAHKIYSQTPGITVFIKEIDL